MEQMLDNMSAYRLPVEVICIFDIDGDVQPLKVRFVVGDSVKVAKIESVVRKESDGEQIKYISQVRDGSVKRMYDLRFNYKAMRWYLYNNFL